MNSWRSSQSRSARGSSAASWTRHSRYLPDRRDLNRCFPRSESGSLASRLARRIFDQLVARVDFAIDLHTASVRRTNFPNIRADLSRPETRALAEASGAAFLVDGVGPKGSLRREANDAGCPTILMEGGEVWKVEPAIVEVALRGIRNVLVWLDMIQAEPVRPPFQVVVKQTRWIRANHGGFLQFHVSAGDIVRRGDLLATNTTLLGREGETLEAPFDAAVLGMTTLPAAGPGEPVCHLGRLEKGTRHLERARERLPDSHPHGRALEDLSSSVSVVEPSPDARAEESYERCVNSPAHPADAACEVKLARHASRQIGGRRSVPSEACWAPSRA